MKYSLESGQDYIDHCVSTVAEIDAQELAQRELGVLIGESARETGASTYSLGKIATANGQLDLAFKSGRMSDHRAKTEIRDISYISSRAPELLPSFPYFIGLITTGRYDSPLGIITEDASKGGADEVWEGYMHPETVRLIQSSCPEARFDAFTLRENTTFDIAGEQRILDLAPSVFGFTISEFAAKNEGFGDVYDKTRKAEKGFSIRLPARSPLAKSIAKLKP